MSGIRVTVTFARQVCDDTDPDISYLEQHCSDGPGENDGPARIAAFKRGDWHMIGVRAVATIWIERNSRVNGAYGTQYTLESPGLWGIESDSGEEYLNEVFAEECAMLKADIEAMKTLEFVS